MEQKPSTSEISSQQPSNAREYRSVTMGIASVLETGELIPNISYKVDPSLPEDVASALCEMHTRCWMVACGIPSPFVGDEKSKPPLWFCNDVIDELLVEHDMISVFNSQKSSYVSVGVGFAAQRHFEADASFISAVLRSRLLLRRIISHTAHEMVGADADKLGPDDFTEQRKETLVRCVAHFASLTDFLDVAAPLSVSPAAYSIMISMVKRAADFSRALSCSGVKDQRILLDFMESLDYRFVSYSTIHYLYTFLWEALSDIPSFSRDPHTLQSMVIILTAFSNCGKIQHISPALKNFLALLKKNVGSNDEHVVSRTVSVLDALCSAVVSGHYSRGSLENIVAAIEREPRFFTDAPHESFNILVSNLSRFIPEEVSAISALSGVDTPEQALTVLGHVYGLSAYLNTPDYCFDVVSALVDAECNTVFIERGMAVSKNDITLLPRHPLTFGLLVSFTSCQRVRNTNSQQSNYRVNFNDDMLRTHLAESNTIPETDNNRTIFTMELNIKETILAMHNEGFDFDGFENAVRESDVLMACDIYGLSSFLRWNRSDVGDLPLRDEETSQEAITKRLRNYPVDNSLKEHSYDNAAIFTRCDGAVFLYNDYGAWRESSSQYAASVLREANVVAFDEHFDKESNFTRLMSNPYHTERTVSL